MTITWRTVTAPNSSSTNALQNQGINNIVGGLSGLGDTFKSGKRAEDAKARQQFEDALVLQKLDQNQQEITSQQEQFDKGLAADLTAAELLNTQKIEAAELANKQANARQALRLNSQKANRESNEKIAKIKAAGKTLNKGSLDKAKGIANKTLDQFFKDNPRLSKQGRANAREMVKLHLEDNFSVHDIPGLLDQAYSVNLFGIDDEDGLKNPREAADLFNGVKRDGNGNIVPSAENENNRNTAKNVVRTGR